ncbi:hypothetical protein VNO78_18286 [Psophocarpus tetragonolobus]|uniref:Uncharacterized protein n=1 Tax=Psophocarpus tetragonolobus TaxID=3891 RepID=A0AAN9SI55_PSOTE
MMEIILVDDIRNLLKELVDKPFDNAKAPIRAANRHPSGSIFKGDVELWGWVTFSEKMKKVAARLLPHVPVYRYGHAMDFQKKRVPFLAFVSAILALSITAEKCRQLVGEKASSQSGKFTFLNCFDMASGTLACSVKEGAKLYFYNIRAAHVEGARHDAMQSALVDAMRKGMSQSASAKYAKKEGDKAAKLASRKAKRITGPIISSGWDFFEAIYYGGTLTEGFLRGSGTLFGTYAGGFLGEQRLGRFGYLLGSHMGSWIGGRIGLMLYDVANGVHFLLHSVHTLGNEN